MQAKMMVCNSLNLRHEEEKQGNMAKSLEDLMSSPAVAEIAKETTSDMLLIFLIIPDIQPDTQYSYNQKNNQSDLFNQSMFKINSCEFKNQKLNIGML